MEGARAGGAMHPSANIYIQVQVHPSANAYIQVQIHPSASWIRVQNKSWTEHVLAGQYMQVQIYTSVQLD